MAIRTQLRVEQLTGSFGLGAGQINDIAANKGALADIVVIDLSGSMSYICSAIRRIHGGTDFSDQVAGEFSQTLLPDTDNTFDLGSTTKAWKDLLLQGDVLMQDAGTLSTAAGALTITSADAASWTTTAGDLTLMAANGANDVRIKGDLIPAQDDTYDLGTAGLAWQDVHLEGDVLMQDAGTVSTAAGGLTITSAGAATWSTSAGILTVTGTGGLSVDSVGTAAVNLATSADAKTITIGNATSAKVSLDAVVVDINGAGTGVTIDALDAGTIAIGTSAVAASDTSAINIGTSATARTITVGNDASTKVDVNALAIELDAAASIVLNSVTTTTLDSTTGMSLDAGAASNFTTSAGALTLKGATGELIGTSGQDSDFAGSVVIAQDLIVNGTATYINTSELMVEDKVVVIGVPGGMVPPGTATYALASNVVTVTSVDHGFSATEWVLIADPAPTVLITEACYQIIAVADDDTFTFAFTRANVAGGTAIDHSADNVTDDTASGAGIMVAPASNTDTSLKWHKTYGWLVAGPSAGAAGISPNVADMGSLGGVDREWSDLYLADASVINFGADQDVTLTHVHEAGLLLNSTMAIQFNDSSQYIKGSSNADLDLAATTDINLDCTTVDVNGALDVSGTSVLAGIVTVNTGIIPDAGGGAYLGTPEAEFASLFLSDGAAVTWGDDQDTTLTHTDGAGLTLNAANKIMFNDATQFIHASSNAILELGATDEIGLTATLVDMNANLDLDGTANVSGLTTLQTGVVPDADGGAYLGTGLLGWNNLFLSDGSVINWANNNSVLTGGSALIESNVALRGLKLEVAGATNVLEVISNDLNVIAAVDMNLEAGGDQINLKGNAVNPGTTWSRSSANTQYLNFSTNDGAVITTNSGGFGFRNNNGSMQFKNSAGSWEDIGSGGGSTNAQKTNVLIATTGSIAAGVAVLNACGGTLLDLSGVTNSLETALVDVYVNGQLLVSSSAGVSYDYALDIRSPDDETKGDFKLQFALSGDDVVTAKVS